MHLTRRDFLLRANALPGMGRRTILGLWRAVLAAELTVITPLDLAELVLQAQLPSRAAHTLMIQLFTSTTEQRVMRELNHCGAVTLADPGYPSQLREIYEPPVVFFYLGTLANLEHPQLGVVGSRHPTGYALRAMRTLLPTVVRANVCVVSGLAQGVDTLSHQVAIAHQGTTIAVVGTGLGRCYPAANHALMQELANHQLVISEYPWTVGPAKFHFVERNRLISGLAQSILVVEAAQRSGSLITANFALQENRNVLAIPGPIDAPNSVGTNELIFAGAKPILKSEHIIEELLVDKQL